MFKDNFLFFDQKGIDNSIAISPKVDRDVKYSGIVGRVLVGETVARYDMLYHNATTGKFEKANATNATKMPIICMALEAGVLNDNVLCLFQGFVQSSDKDWTVRASGTITISGNIADGDYFTIGGVTYEFDTNSAWTAGRVQVYCSAVTNTVAQTALSAVLKEYSRYKVQQPGAWAANILTLYAYDGGTPGNSVGLVKSGTNLAVSGANMTGGVDGALVYGSISVNGGIQYTAPVTTSNIVQFLGRSLAYNQFYFNPTFHYHVI
jgi:hypothetical protein